MRRDPIYEVKVKTNAANLLATKIIKLETIYFLGFLHISSLNPAALVPEVQPLAVGRGKVHRVQAPHYPFPVTLDALAENIKIIIK